MPADRAPVFEEKKRKPRSTHAPYVKRRERKDKQPKSSAQPLATKKRENLTLFDWLTVLDFVKAHPDMSQAAVVDYFRTRAEGVLIFDQSTLSRKIRERATLEARANSHPNALSGKRARVVTRPDVERALFLWVKHMEAKNETVNGAMLTSKRAWFEEQLGVPAEERLSGEGWLANFTKAYNIKEHRRHGEAASVNPAAVEAERKRIQSLIGRYAPKDRFNADETSLFAFAPPDRGLATKQMSGKKSDKFRITMMVACNADGSEKLPLLFIGRYKKPRCFGGRNADEHGLYYRNNKTAWMNQEIFQEWLKNLDLDMVKRNRRICLLLDNFSGHYVVYKPRNIEVIFFDPGLTSFVQPCDGGIIRTLKALYRKAFCLRAIDQDEAGEREIYKINLLEAMLLVKRAWADVKPQTIANCWRHTKIQPEGQLQTGNSSPNGSPDNVEAVWVKAWGVVYEFAASDEMRLPDAEQLLRSVLGDQYIDKDWQPALKAVMDAENDVDLAIEHLDRLKAADIRARQSAKTHCGAPATIPAPAPTTSQPVPVNNQLAEAETALTNAVDELVSRRRIIGTRLTLEEMLNPVEELQIGEGSDRFEEDKEGDPGAAIIKQVQHEEAVKRGEIIEIDDDDEEEDEEKGGDGDKLPCVSRKDAMELCGALEGCVLRYGSGDAVLGLLDALRSFRVHLRREEMAVAKQTSLDNWIRK